MDADLLQRLCRPTTDQYFAALAASSSVAEQKYPVVADLCTACFDVARSIDASYGELLTSAAQVALRIAWEAAEPVDQVIRMFSSPMQRLEALEARLPIDISSVPCAAQVGEQEQEQRIDALVAALSGRNNEPQPEPRYRIHAAINVLVRVALDTQMSSSRLEGVLRYLDKHLRPTIFQA